MDWKACTKGLTISEGTQRMTIKTRGCDRQSTHRYPEVILYGTHCSARECSGRGASLAWRSHRVSSMHLCAQHSYLEETAEHKVTSESEYKLRTSSTICSACSLFSVTALAPGSSGCSRSCACWGALALPDSRWRIIYRCICNQQRIEACICNAGAGELFASTMRRIAATIQCHSLPFTKGSRRATKAAQTYKCKIFVSNLKLVGVSPRYASLTLVVCWIFRPGFVQCEAHKSSRWLQRGFSKRAYTTI